MKPSLKDNMDDFRSDLKREGEKMLRDMHDAMTAPSSNLSNEIEDMLAKYVANYNLDVLSHRQSGQQTLIEALTTLFNKQILAELIELNREHTKVCGAGYSDVPRDDCSLPRQLADRIKEVE